MKSRATTCPCIVNERTMCRPNGGTCWHFGNDRPECAFCKNGGLYYPDAVTTSITIPSASEGKE